MLGDNQLLDSRTAVRKQIIEYDHVPRGLRLGCGVLGQTEAVAYRLWL